jgi:hypothetical protein
MEMVTSSREEHKPTSVLIEELLGKLAQRDADIAEAITLMKNCNNLTCRALMEAIPAKDQLHGIEIASFWMRLKWLFTGVKRENVDGEPDEKDA